jgi:hypothetical protein
MNESKKKPAMAPFGEGKPINGIDFFFSHQPLLWHI